MRINGTIELEDTSKEEVWLALSDPALIKNALPGCKFLLEVTAKNPDFDELRKRAEGKDWEISMDPDVVSERSIEQGDRYAALMEISVGSVSPSFESVVTIDERKFPKMKASGTGEASSSSFEMESGIHLKESDGGVRIEWWAKAEIFGRIAQMGQRVIKPVANRVVNRFFQRVQDQLETLDPDEELTTDADEEDVTFVNRIRDRMGI